MTDPSTPVDGTSAQGAAAHSTPAWRLAHVVTVRLELPGVYPEVVLQEDEAPWRRLHIPVGFAEGTAIAYALKQVPTARPLTHQLAVELLDRHGVDVVAVRVTGRQGTLFLAELETMGPSGRHVVPCRPSDGIALVLRRTLPTPMLVADDLFERIMAPAPEVPVPEMPASEAHVPETPAEP